MLKRPRSRFLSLLLGLVAGLTACDNGVTPDELAGPSFDGVTPYEWNAVPLATDVEVHGNTVIAVIGPDGGRIANREHWLWVPTNAVSSATEFTFKVVGGKNVKVDFKAARVADGVAVSRFPVALTVGLSYANSKVTTPNRLYVGYFMEGTMAGAIERLPSTVWTELQLVTAPIWHFSEYGIILD